MDAPTMSHVRVGRQCIAVAHRPVPLAAEDWAAFAQTVREVGKARGSVSFCVRIEGPGGPDAAMRAELNELADQFPIRAAILTRSRLAKGVAMAISWIGKVKIKAFDPDKLGSAVAWLELPQTEHAELEDALRKLAAELGTEPA